MNLSANQPVPTPLVEALLACNEAVYRGSEVADLTSLASDRSKLTLAWVPAWYSRENDLLGGLWSLHWLQARGTVELKAVLEQHGFHGVLWSGHSGGPRGFSFGGRIDRIFHGKFGELRGLTRQESIFSVTHADGTRIVLNDEDSAGFCDYENVTPKDWNLRVEMTVDPEEVRRGREWVLKLEQSLPPKRTPPVI